MSDLDRMEVLVFKRCIPHASPDSDLCSLFGWVTVAELELPTTSIRSPPSKVPGWIFIRKLEAKSDGAGWLSKTWCGVWCGEGIEERN